MDTAFKNKSPLLRNRSVVQSFCTLAARFVENDNQNGAEGEFFDFINAFMEELARQVEMGQQADDFDYLEFQQTINANVKGAAKQRHQILMRKMIVSRPDLADRLGPAIVMQSGAKSCIPGIVDRIAGQITTLNSKYASLNGSELFKTTNKTTAALSVIRQPIQDHGEYGTLVDSLYFLLWESSGDRLSVRPQAFSDIRDLRTELRHDIDHGKSRKVVAKRKKLAEVFRRYSGETNPGTMAPHKFPLVHAALLTEVEKGLRAVSV
jgi:hypothetical protein